MLIFRLLLVIIFVFLKGCASLPDKSGVQDGLVEPVKIVEFKVKHQQGAEKTALESDVMYMLMSAELAGQRGQYANALEGYMEAAKHANDPRFAERAAKIAMYMKDDKKTDEAVSLWLKLEPNNSTVRRITALSALRFGDKEAAVDHLSVVLNGDPAGFEKTVLELSSILRQDGKSDIVYQVLDALALKNPRHAVVYFVQSLLAMEMKNYPLAEQKIQQTLSIRPDWDKALVFQAQIAVYSGDLLKAKNLLKNAVNKFPGNVKLKKLLAQVLVKTGGYEAAAGIYQEIILANPKDAESQVALALVYLQLDRDGKAEAIFKRLLDQPDWQSQASFYLAKIEEKRGHIQKALAWFDKVSDGSLVFESAISAVSLLVKDKKFSEADMRLGVLASQFPKQKLRIILMRSSLYGQQRQYEKAFKLLTDTLIEYPEQRDLLYTRALMAERVDKLDVLEVDLKKILAKFPEDAEALNALGYSLLGHSNRYGEAEKYLKQALSLQPDEAVIIDSFGWLQFKIGRYGEALSFLERAYAKQQEAEIAAHLAEVLWALGRKDKATRIFHKAIKKAPDDEYLLDFKKRILSGEK